MIVGDRISLRGFDVVARAEVAEGGGDPNSFGEFAVLNNNSSYYHVVRRAVEGDQGVLVASFVYSDEPEYDFKRAYKLALEFMIVEAMKW